MVKLVLRCMVCCLFLGASAFALSQSHIDFIHAVVGRVDQANSVILKDRTELKELQAHYQDAGHLSFLESYRLKHIVKRYGLSDFQITAATDWRALWQRVDVIPPSLAVAQAITESAWGQSRFARDGSNYFGIWCYRPGCGLVPQRRAPGQIYEVKSYHSMQASVTDYIRNLNTHRAYASFREVRYQERRQHRGLNSLLLAHQLHAYSGQNDAYTSIIRQIIKQYHLQQYDQKLGGMLPGVRG